MAPRSTGNSVEVFGPAIAEIAGDVQPGKGPDSLAEANNIDPICRRLAPPGFRESQEVFCFQ